MPTALVTGASSGIGAAFAKRLAADGYGLVLVARNESRLLDARAELLALGAPDVEVLPADLTDTLQRHTICARLADDSRPVDLLVNNAGMGLGVGFLRATEEQLRQQLDLNVTAVMLLTHATLPGMVARGHGGVVTISSVAGMVPGRGSAYGASKAWATSFSESIGLAVRGKGVRMLAVCPGYVRTEFHERAGIKGHGIPDFMWLQADSLVKECLEDVDRGKVISIPGPQYKLAATALRVLPRPIVRGGKLARKHRPQ